MRAISLGRVGSVSDHAPTRVPPAHRVRVGLRRALPAGATFDAMSEKEHPSFGHAEGELHAPIVENDSGTEMPEEISDSEGAVHGAVTLPELRSFLDAWAQSQLGSAIADIRFRAGRIDDVWGVELQDGRAAVIKAHRTPVDIDAASASVDAPTRAGGAGFPCPIPLAGPEVVDGRVLTAESLIVGGRPDGRHSATRGRARPPHRHPPRSFRSRPTPVLARRGADTRTGRGRFLTTLLSTWSRPSLVSSASTLSGSELLHRSSTTARRTRSS